MAAGAGLRAPRRSEPAGGSAPLGAAATDGPPPRAAATASEALAAALADRDLEAAAACFTRDACFLTPDATTIHGREEIRGILAQLIAAGARLEVLSSAVVPAGEVVLGTERWLFRHRGGEGGFEQLCTAVTVARRVEGSWKLAIAAPWGWGRER